MANVAQQILNLTKRLYPTGRAFRLAIGSQWEQVHLALRETELDAYNNAIGILNKILADNPNFTADDASDWERRLGIAADINTSLDDRKAAILRKYSHPGNILGRQSASYVEGQLQEAGFNVFVHENPTGIDPSDFITGVALNFAGENAFFGSDAVFGAGTSDFLVVNSLDPSIDQNFNLGSDFRNAFFIGGATLGDFSNVPTNRETEFRQLILTLKPVHLAAVLLINYV